MIFFSAIFYITNIEEEKQRSLKSKKRQIIIQWPKYKEEKDKHWSTKHYTVIGNRKALNGGLGVDWMED